MPPARRPNLQLSGVVGPVVEVLKSELIKARAAAKQPAVDVEIDQCRKFIARSERRIKEMDWTLNVPKRVFQ